MYFVTESENKHRAKDCCGRTSESLGVPVRSPLVATPFWPSQVLRTRWYSEQQVQRCDGDARIGHSSDSSGSSVSDSDYQSLRGPLRLGR